MTMNVLLFKLYPGPGGSAFPRQVGLFFSQCLSANILTQSELIPLHLKVQLSIDQRTVPNFSISIMGREYSELIKVYIPIISPSLSFTKSFTTQHNTTRHDTTQHHENEILGPPPNHPWSAGHEHNRPPKQLRGKQSTAQPCRYHNKRLH